MVTTIQLNEDVKKQLDNLKIAKETYEEIIINLMKFAERIKRGQKEFLIEACREMAEENLKITKRFEAIENLNDWEW